MSKRTKKPQSRCQDHVFQLKSLYNQSKLPQRTCISFCENFRNKKQTKTCKNHSSQILSYPIYNSDHNHATPSFILREDRCHFKQQGQRLREQHDMKMQSYRDEKDSLNVPKPKSKTNHCNVCRQPYQDYLTHIQSQTHYEKSRNNLYTKYINDLAHKFQAWNLKNKNKIYNSSHHTLATQGEQQKDIPESIPKKKIKTQETSHFHQNIQSVVPLENLPNSAVLQKNNVEPNPNNVIPQAFPNNSNPNLCYSSYFYPISYPYFCLNPNPNQSFPLPFYYWVNYPQNCQQNNINFPNIGPNQQSFYGYQQYIIPPNMTQTSLYNQNFPTHQ